MSLEIKVPAVGESITEVILSKWIKNDGEHVEMDEVIAELESDKATFELTAESAGTLSTIAKEGDTLEIGAVVAKIDPSGEAKASAEPSTAEAAEPVKTEAVGEEKTVEIKVPAVGESITEVTLTRWIKTDGDTVEMDEVIAELESDKATFELPAEAAGVLTTVAKEGDTLEIGAVVATISSNGSAAPKAAAQSQEAAPKTAESESKSKYADK